ncbi:MAG: glutathione S-transferase family protein [Burkholderiales bacterium]
MSALTLVIGNKNYSSWSMRPWILMKATSIHFEELMVPLKRESGESRERILPYSPTGKVPVLMDGQAKVWESLAICEYLAEKFPEKELWPEDPVARALARSVSAEMHSGFAELRRHMPMDCRSRFPKQEIPAAVEADISRILDIWNDCRTRYGQHGDFLFGDFSIADAMFAPVTRRFISYHVPLHDSARRYVDAVDALPAMRSWLSAAAKEPDFA